MTDPAKFDGARSAQTFEPPEAKLAERLARRIEQDIVDMGWPVGRIFGGEPNLLEKYGVSRAVFREAVRLLEHDQIMTMRKGRRGGLVVTAPDASAVTNAVATYLRYRRVTPAQLLETRRTLELSAIELAIERGTKRNFEDLRAWVDQAQQAESAGDLERSEEAAHGLHIRIAQLSGDPALELFVTVFTRLAILLTDFPDRGREEASQTVFHAHTRIVDAIVAKDAKLAKARMGRHLEAISPFLRDSSGGPAQKPPSRSTKTPRKSASRD